MKIKLIILMFVVSVLLLSCAHQTDQIPKYPTQLPSQYAYVVKPGDTLYKIAQQYNKYGITAKDIALENKILPPYDKVKVGRTLTIPLSPINGAGIKAGCEVKVISINTFSYLCPPSVSQCTGAYSVIGNTSRTIKTVTIQYQQLEQINVLSQNVQIPAKSMIDYRVYEVPNTFSERDIFITCH